MEATLAGVKSRWRLVAGGALEQRQSCCDAGGGDRSTCWSGSSGSVFINFRGKDIDGFLSFLFESLKEKGINTFKDENLKKGTEITPALKQTIQESCISIVIFSKNYADSPWCLDELVVINKCREKGGQMVLPVFYRVDPTDVQELRGPFTKALARLLQDHSDRSSDDSSHNLGGWCHALKTISNDLSAFVSNEIKNDQMLVQRIVNRVSEILSHMPSNASYHDKLVGIDSRVEEVISLLDVDVNNRNWRIGIWGMAGIGKTTLAGIVFSQIKVKFDAHCFVSNVKVQIRKETEIVLRDKIIRSLLGDEYLKIGSPLLVLDDWIMRRLQKKKVLIVFDDDDVVIKRFRSFSWKLLLAFNGKEKRYWESQLPQIENIPPNKRIQDVLKISYDGLDRNEQSIFLDIACFFGNGDKAENELEKIIESFGFFARSGIRSLIDKSLITIFYGQVKMHNLLKQMGKEIVNEECKQPGGRSRLWNPEDIYHVFKTNTGTDKVECISLRMSDAIALGISSKSFITMPDLRLNSKTFMKILNLRFLRISANWILADGLDFLPEQLRYLSWHRYPLKSLPLKFCPNNLVQLHLPDSQLKQLWDGDNKPFQAPNLEELCLSSCSSLIEIPSSLKYSTKLALLNLEDCESIRSLPSFLQLENLEILNLRGCSKLEECPEIPCNLRDLNLSKTAIKQLPSSIGHCSQLVALLLSGCTKLQKLPDCIGQLQSLEYIDFTDLKFSKLPNNFGYLKSLKKLDVRGSGIKTLPSSFNQLSRLKRLCFEGCKGLTVWSSSLSGLNDLRKLYLGNCGISEIPESIGSLVSLKELYLNGNDFESIPASIKQLSHLETLRLDDCKRLRYLPELPGTRSFSASNCTSLEFVSFSSFPKAETEDGIQLNFGNCIKLGDNVRLQITEALFSAQQGQNHHRLCIPGLEMLQSMKYRTSGSHLSVQLERPDRMLGFYSAAVIDFQDFDFHGHNIRGIGNFEDKSGKMYEYDCDFYFGHRRRPKIDSKHFLLGYKSFDHERNFTRVSFHVDHFSVNYSGKGEVISGRVINCGIHPIYREEYRKAERRNVRRKEPNKDIVEAANTQTLELLGLNYGRRIQDKNSD
ncbi:LOW QUALITY PROTEIN: disease resistance protein RPV1 [Jatropha curcas]|uniref:LOW QUALITY PROTEIN: disease resistance protein RPV1 n=1 Tax=Jatropha curcas TaxID=180498 RepID=UPI00189454A8|nr:LOW QUALITY PROTEIN: disease resistance protein RPV1 [Jatropha curcas]